MDKKNIGLLHGLLFAVFAVVLVYCGEQVRANTNGAASWLMRASAITIALGVVSLTISFIPAVKSNKWAEERNKYEQNVSNLYSYNGNKVENFRKDTVEKVESGARYAGYFGALQNIYDRWNKRLTYLSVGLMVVSVILFSIGVCLL